MTGQVHLARGDPQRALEGLVRGLLTDPHHAADVVPSVQVPLVLPAGRVRQVDALPDPVHHPGGVNAAEAAAGVGLVDGGGRRSEALCKDSSLLIWRDEVRGQKGARRAHLAP